MGTCHFVFFVPLFLDLSDAFAIILCFCVCVFLSLPFVSMRWCVLMLVLPVACSCGALYWFEVHFVSRHLHSKKKEREVEEEGRNNNTLVPPSRIGKAYKKIDG